MVEGVSGIANGLDCRLSGSELNPRLDFDTLRTMLRMTVVAKKSTSSWIDSMTDGLLILMIVGYSLDIQIDWLDELLWLSFFPPDGAGSGQFHRHQLEYFESSWSEICRR